MSEFYGEDPSSEGYLPSKILPSVSLPDEVSQKSTHDKEDAPDYFSDVPPSILLLYRTTRSQKEQHFLNESLTDLGIILHFAEKTTNYIISPPVPLKVHLQETVFHGSASLFPGTKNLLTYVSDSMFVAFDTIRQTKVKNGKKTSEFYCDGKPIYLRNPSPDGKELYQEDDSRIVISHKEKVNTVVFHRHEGRVEMFEGHNHFKCNGRLYQKTPKGKLQGKHVFTVCLFDRSTYPDEVETCLLHSDTSYLFQHQGEWYECYWTSIYHVRSGEAVHNCGVIIRDGYYCDGSLLISSPSGKILHYNIA